MRKNFRIDRRTSESEYEVLKYDLSASGRLVEFWCKVRGFIDNFPGKYWLFHRFHPRHRYNILRTGRPPGYYDLEERIESALIHEFARFMERNRERWESPDPDSPTRDLEQEHHARKWSGLVEIYARIREADIGKMSYDDMTNILCGIVRDRNCLWD